jgi:hypothetical protein
MALFHVKHIKHFQYDFIFCNINAVYVFLNMQLDILNR